MRAVRTIGGAVIGATLGSTAVALEEKKQVPAAVTPDDGHEVPPEVPPVPLLQNEARPGPVALEDEGSWVPQTPPRQWNWWNATAFHDDEVLAFASTAL
jgi:hypothetical protein